MVDLCKLCHFNFLLVLSVLGKTPSGSFRYYIHICCVHSQSYHIICCYPSHFAKWGLFRLPHRQEKKRFFGLDTLWACVCSDNFSHSEIKGRISAPWKKRNIDRSTSKTYPRLQSSHGILHISKMKSCSGSSGIGPVPWGSAAHSGASLALSFLLSKGLFPWKSE